VNGPVDFGGGTVNVVPGGVTIVSSDPITTDIGLSAATTSSVADGAIPGVLLATSAGGTAVSLAGGVNLVFSGLIYARNGTLNISNGVNNTVPGCAEVDANDIILLGGANFSSSTLEFAVIGGVLLLTPFGTIELGLLMWTHNALQATLMARCAALIRRSSR
jgi:hypothetical protein